MPVCDRLKVVLPVRKVDIALVINGNELAFSKEAVKHQKDGVSGRSEHRFARQRARFESSTISTERGNDVVDQFLGRTLTSVMNCSGN